MGEHALGTPAPAGRGRDWARAESLYTRFLAADKIARDLEELVRTAQRFAWDVHVLDDQPLMEALAALEVSTASVRVETGEDGPRSRLEVAFATEQTRLRFAGDWRPASRAERFALASSGRSSIVIDDAVVS